MEKWISPVRPRHKPASVFLTFHFSLNPDVSILQEVAESINCWSLFKCLKRSTEGFFLPAAFVNVDVISSSSCDS